MQKTPEKFMIGDLLNCKIKTAEGKTIGHVSDIQLTQGPEYRVVAIMYGWRGLLYRLHVFNPFAIIAKQQRPEPNMIPWDAVASFTRPIVKLKPGYEVKQDQKSRPKQ